VTRETGPDHDTVPRELPRGPHALSREQVARSQRQRLVAAMIDAIGDHGYVKTTVADVIARAGVSRKAFYEHFPNKQECFLTAYDTVAAEGAERVRSAYLRAEGLPDSTTSALGALFELAIENPRVVRLVLVEIGAVGPAGIARRERLLAGLEALLRESLGLVPGPGTVPNPVLRAVIGGLNRVLYTHAQSGEDTNLLDLVPDLVRWATSYLPPREMATLQDRLLSSTRARTSLTGGRAPGTLFPHTRMSDRRGLLPGERNVSRSFVVHSQRERILDAVANLTTESGYAGLTSQSIVDEAAVSLQSFYTHFTDKEDAFLVAYEVGHGKALASAERAYAAEPDWRSGVRAAIAALFDFLASERSFAHLAFVDALTATPSTADRSNMGMLAYGQLLVPGYEEAPTAQRPPAVTIEAIAGGVVELCLSHALQESIGELPGLVPPATYFALAPFIGAEEAGRVATEPATG
jgi:AcrR family transcriptional regulator